jgi:hypothetical protein
MRIGVVGFPGLYGGAGVELDDQLTLWHGAGWEVHVVPSWDPTLEPLLRATQARATVHAPEDWAAFAGMPVVSFCNDVFLRNVEQIREHASRTVWVNCMTWLFPDERKAHAAGLIDTFLYQTQVTLDAVRPELEEINPEFDGRVFHSWFDASRFPFHARRPRDKFRFGRISREDADKYAADQLWVYETMVSPVPKSGSSWGSITARRRRWGSRPTGSARTRGPASASRSSTHTRRRWSRSAKRPRTGRAWAWRRWPAAVCWSWTIGAGGGSR